MSLSQTAHGHTYQLMLCLSMVKDFHYQRLFTDVLGKKAGEIEYLVEFGIEVLLDDF